MVSATVRPPISDLFILSPSGNPLYARTYVKTDFQADSVLLAGFLSAIEIFTTNNLQGQLTDLGLGDRRYFFGRSQNGYLSVVSTFAEKPLVINSALASIASSFLKMVGIAYDMIAETANSLQIDVNDLIVGFGITVDSILFETTLEYTELDEQFNQRDFGSLSGEEIDQSNLSGILKEINQKTKTFLQHLGEA